MKSVNLFSIIILSIVCNYNKYLSAQDLNGMQNAYSTYFGGSSAERINALKIDNEGFLYIAGFTNSDDFPVTENAYSKKRMGDLDGYVAKIDINTNKIIWATYIGGTNVEYLSDMEIDNEGNVYIIGNTLSSDFPTSENAYDRSFNGASGGNHGDLYIAKLSNDGAKLLFSTYLGGSDTESFENLALDNNGNIYICSSTSSTDYPITLNTLDSTFNGQNSGNYLADIAISKLSNDGSKLLFSTFLGGRGNETATINIDLQGRLFVIGQTSSSNFPVTNNSYFTCQDTSFRGDGNLFLTIIDSACSEISHSTYFGGNNKNCLYDMKFDNSGNLYLVGSTLSTDMGTNNNTYQNELSGEKDAFIMKYDLSKDVVQYFTYLGGAKSEQISRLNIDERGDLIIVGTTFSEDFPTSENALGSEYNGCIGTNYPWGGDCFISIIDSTLSIRKYSTYLGGTGDDHWPIAILKDTNIFIGISSKSNDFPVTDNALFKNYCGGTMQGGDAILLKFSINELLNYSSPSGTNTLDHKKKVINVYPNPASQRINIIGLENMNVIYKIINTSNIVLVGGFLCSNTIDISEIPEGLHLLSLIFPDKVESIKFLKQ